MNGLPDEILSRILFLAATPHIDSQLDAAASDTVPSVDSDVSPCHGMGMVSKRWASLLPVVRITAAADSPSRREDSADQYDSLLPASTLSAPALFRALSRAPSVTSLTLGDDALDLYDHHFLTSLLAACPKLTCVSLGEPCFTAAPPPFTIGLAPLDSFFRAAAPQLQELALLLPPVVTRLPDSISSLSSLRVLRLRSNTLQQLPDGLCHLRALQELHLTCPMLQELPENLGQLKALRHLSMRRGCRSSYRPPDSLGDLSLLSSLRINGNLQQLRRLELQHFEGELPDAWAKLEEVSLDKCSMRSLPPTWLETLTRLTLRSCDHLEPLPIHHIPCDLPLRHLTVEGVWSTVPFHPLSRLTSLQRLKVLGSRSRGNVNVDFPVGLFALPSLSHVSVDRSLSLEYNFRSTFSSGSSGGDGDGSCSSLECKRLALPAFISHLTSLTEVHLTDVFIPSPPPHLARLLSLRKLCIKESAYFPHTGTFVPDNISELVALEWLELKGRVPEKRVLSFLERMTRMTSPEELLAQCSQLEHLPQEFGSLGALTKVTIEGVFSSLPNTLSGLSSLQEASLTSPVLASLPPSFCLLSRLHTLTITGSGCLVTLPADFGSLGALQRLSIHSCSHLQSLPDSFSSLVSLVRLTITQCPNLSNLPHGFGSLPRLAWLTINGCESFTHLPASFPSLLSLRVADFRRCERLHSLPPQMGLLPLLEVLHLQDRSALKSLPDSLRWARSLRHVDVSYSGLDKEGGSAGWCGTGV
ncbi:unnamed protein product [Closterium sp. NIES-64]|nr:unnamed protein product [Closterium sp. NIES-64]